MKKILLLILITAFIGCDTEPKLAGQFLVGQDGAERKLELGSDEDAMFIKEAVLGWAAKEYEKIREKFGDSLIVRRPSGNYTNAVKIENWENYGATYDSMTRNIISIIPMKMSPNGYRFVDVFFNQNVYSDTIIDESRRFERYWINSETEKIAALSVIMEEE